MKKLLTKKDLIILAVVSLVGIAGILWMNSADKGQNAVVEYDGQVVEVIPLEGEYYETSVNGVTICRENGKVYVRESSCFDKVCVRSGELSKSGESAVCAPNRVSVRISGEKESSPDAITG